jgi:hypothetical protein
MDACSGQAASAIACFGILDQKDPFECSCGRPKSRYVLGLVLLSVTRSALVPARARLALAARLGRIGLAVIPVREVHVHLKCPSQSRGEKTHRLRSCRIGAMGPRFQCKSTRPRFRSRVLKQVQIFI